MKKGYIIGGLLLISSLLVIVFIFYQKKDKNIERSQVESEQLNEFDTEDIKAIFHSNEDLYVEDATDDMADIDWKADEHIYEATKVEEVVREWYYVALEEVVGQLKNKSEEAYNNMHMDEIEAAGCYYPEKVFWEDMETFIDNDAPVTTLDSVELSDRAYVTFYVGNSTDVYVFTLYEDGTYLPLPDNEMFMGKYTLSIIKREDVQNKNPDVVE